MKNILILSITLLIGGASGCATSLDVLTAEAKQCDIEQRTDCWIDVNKRLRAIAKREAEKAAKCSRGTIGWCERRGMRDRRCSCVRTW